jgi:xanthine dehydrogenase accessory factor
MRELIPDILRLIESRLPGVFCSVVAARGSTPQKPGAAMLVYGDGSQAGTLGGGCVEAEVKRLALQALNETPSVPRIHTFMLDDDYGWDDGLICGGRLTVLAEPISDATAQYYSAMADLARGDAAWSEAIALENNRGGYGAGARSLFDAEGTLIASLNGPTIPVSQADGFAVLQTPARIKLLIVGGGHVGKAVAQLASEVGFEIWVLDDRDSCVTSERFPTATRRLVGDVGRTLQSLKSEITPATFALIVTRGHNNDEEALYHLATTPARYIGMIGSRRKVRLIFDDLEAKGIAKEALERVHAPVGFEIGSQSVAEIAVSIVAELIACRNLSTSVRQVSQKSVNHSK